MTRQTAALRSWLMANPRHRRTLLAIGIYLVASVVYAAFAPSSLFRAHTPYNHFAHSAAAWLNGQLDLPDGAPAYAQNNDFAVFEGRTYIVFPPFPAVVLLPFVALAGSPEALADGAIFLWLAGLGPALLFLALERLRTTGQSERTEVGNAFLSLCFAFGTVFFFSAEQGTVWFAAHVVGVVLAALYLLLVIGARYPIAAGVVLGLALSTRAPLAFAAPLFAFEAVRATARVPFAATNGDFVARLLAFARGIEWPRLIKSLVLFSLPVALCIALGWWHNAARFGDPLETGYRFLTVAWQKRMNEWGLFHYHYLARNLGVMLTSLPWLERDVPVRINMHGLALWFTTPLYFWLLWPKRRPAMHLGLWVTVACVALPTLLYQNSGWAQFGYRFSNDYAVFLFALLALGVRRLGPLFWFAAVWSVVVNAFGALTFQRSGYEDLYYGKGGQKVLYQPD